MVKWGTMATSFGLEHLGWMLGKPSLLGEWYSPPQKAVETTLRQTVAGFLFLEFSKAELDKATDVPSYTSVLWNLHRTEHPKISALVDHILPVILTHVALLIKWPTLSDGQGCRRNSHPQGIPQMTGWAEDREEEEKKQVKLLLWWAEV